MNQNTRNNSCTGSIQIAALKDADGTKVDGVLRKVVNDLRQKGYRLAGAVRPCSSLFDENRCDLFLEELSTSTVLPVSQALGTGSQACRLDDAALDAIAERIETSLQDGADILILNKFGKQEAEGRGLRNSIATAVDQGIPVLVGLNPSRVETWNNFCGGASKIFDLGDPAIRRWLQARVLDT